MTKTKQPVVTSVSLPFPSAQKPTTVKVRKERTVYKRKDGAEMIILGGQLKKVTREGGIATVHLFPRLIKLSEKRGPVSFES